MSNSACQVGPSVSYWFPAMDVREADAGSHCRAAKDARSRRKHRQALPTKRAAGGSRAAPAKRSGPPAQRAQRANEASDDASSMETDGSEERGDGVLPHDVEKILAARDGGDRGEEYYVKLKGADVVLRPKLLGGASSVFALHPTRRAMHCCLDEGGATVHN
jgi:hypothetical protein